VWGGGGVYVMYWAVYLLHPDSNLVIVASSVLIQGIYIYITKFSSDE
jgi:hypothetical protein